MTPSPPDKKHLPTWLSLVIVGTRLCVTGATTLFVLFLGNHFFNIPAQLLPLSGTPTELLVYFVVVGIVALVVTGVMIWPAMAISWGVAWLLSEQIRQDMREFLDEQNETDD